jgi:phage/plasmid primase-like uncharacterized protein
LSIPAEAIDRARGVDALEVARRYIVLKRVTANEWAGPCPGCGGNDRFRLNPKKQVFLCRQCGAKGKGAIDLVMLALGVGFAKAVEELAGQWTSPPPTLRAPAKTTQEEDAAHNSRRALAIFGSARSIRGTIAERYLTKVRGCDLNQLLELDDVLQFEPRCPFGTELLPCLIALVRDVLTNAPKAIQRTVLNSDGQKIDRRSLGPTKSGAVKLWPDAEVTYGLVVGEGLETTAAAATHIEHRGTLLQPAWALIDSANLSSFPVLPGVEALTILVDHDANGVGQAAAAACAARWSGAGREAIRLTPEIGGTDFNDLTLRRGGAR